MRLLNSVFSNETSSVSFLCNHGFVIGGLHTELSNCDEGERERDPMNIISDLSRIKMWHTFMLHTNIEDELASSKVNAIKTMNVNDI